jgi:hypothetical protein
MSLNWIRSPSLVVCLLTSLADEAEYAAGALQLHSITTRRSHHCHGNPRTFQQILQNRKIFVKTCSTENLLYLFDSFTDSSLWLYHIIWEANLYKLQNLIIKCCHVQSVRHITDVGVEERQVSVCYWLNSFTSGAVLKNQLAMLLFVTWILQPSVLLL